MSTHKLQFFLTGRLSQDPVENLFSQARGQGIMHPSCSVFRQALRLITVAQYLQVIKGAAYEEDGCTYLIDYLKQRADGVEADEESLLPALLTASDVNNEVEESSLQLLLTASDVNNDVEESSLPLLLTASDVDDEVEESLPLLLTASDGDNEVEESSLPLLLTASDADEVEESSLPLLLTASDADDADGIEVATSTTVDSPLQPVENVCHSRPLEKLEGNALYDIMGWALSRIFRKVDCDVCCSAFTADSISNDCFGQYTVARNYGGLMHPSNELLTAAKLAEQTFVSNKPTMHRKADIDLCITMQVLDVINSCNFNFPTCHNILQNVFKKYIRLRINQHAKAITSNDTLMKKRQYGSKTACRITLIP